MLIGDGGHAKVIKSFYDCRNQVLIAIGDNRARKKEASAYQNFGTAIHRSAIVKTNEIGEGTVIMANVVIQAGAKIGKHCIINTGASIDHDCVLEDFVHIAPGAHLCGNVHVGEGSLIGVSVGIAPNTIIPPWKLVKAARLDIVPL